MATEGLILERAKDYPPNLETRITENEMMFHGWIVLPPQAACDAIW
jgi:hypothetical protein